MSTDRTPTKDHPYYPGVHRGEYRAQLFAMTMTELREQLDQALGKFRSTLPIQDDGDFYLAKSAALDLVDVLEAIECRAYYRPYGAEAFP